MEFSRLTKLKSLTSVYIDMKDFVYLAGDSLECHIYETLKYAEATHKGKGMWRVTCYQGFPLPRGIDIYIYTQ